ncbi:MAG: AAA family ATPase [Deltaproteobacteria bacterium]|nr:AAA family ATPase [Deltaproteobacteria bacterium]MBI3391031.1 AAA family ATPase [Deltaproteobacteria bacterium]
MSAESAKKAPSAGETLGRLREELAQLFLERGDLIDGALCALLAGQHVLIIGPPGTAKSMLADELCRRLDGAQYFQWLLTKFTTPEELFGAVSLKALENDDYRRVTTHKLPEAHIAFLDEVFKANSSILNAILTLMNERRFHNGREVGTVPLITLFAASNELPEEDELQALYDRFLVRFVVGYIDEDFRFLKMLQAKPPDTRTTLSLADLQALQAAAHEVAVPAHIYRSLADLRKQLARKHIIASDRRYRQCLALLQARALLLGRHEVVEDDLFLLDHVLWREPAERNEIHAAIHELLRGYEDEVKVLLYQTRELRDYAHRQWENNELRSRAVVEAHTKIRNILAKVATILDEARAVGRPVDTVQKVKDEIEGIQQRMLEAL